MLSTLAVTIALAQQTATAPTLKYAATLSLSVGGTDGKLVATAVRTTKAADKGQTILFAWTDAKLTIAGMESDLPELEPFKYTAKPDGAISAISGGIPQLPATSFVLLMHLFAPKEALAVDGTATFKIAKEGETPAFTISLKRDADEETAGVKFKKFTQTIKSDGDDTLDTVGTYWVKEDGAVFKIEHKIASIKVGDGGDSGKGTFTFVLKK